MQKGAKFKDGKETEKKTFFSLWGEGVLILHNLTPKAAVNCLALGLGARPEYGTWLLHSECRFSQCHWAGAGCTGPESLLCLMIGCQRVGVLAAGWAMGAR